MLLTLLMNLDFAAGEVVAPPAPPSGVSGGVVGGGGYINYYESEENEKNRRRINELIKEDEIFFAVIQSFMKWL